MNNLILEQMLEYFIENNIVLNNGNNVPVCEINLGNLYTILPQQNIKLFGRNFDIKSFEVKKHILYFNH